MTTAQVQQPSEGSMGRRADFPMRGWRARFGRSTFGVALALVAIWAGFKTGATIDKTAVSLGLSGPVAPMPEPPPEPLTTLPPATRQSLPEVASTSSVQAGTEGLSLPPPPALPGDAACTLAIIGDLAPANAASEKYLQQTATQLNLLRPDAVFTIGNLVPGYSRSSQTYANEVLALRGILDTLKMPWFPCVGSSDVTSGTRDPDDHRFVTLYQKYFGPLYYSADCGNVHVIVLDSEAGGEGAGQGNRISEAQLAWLKADLNKTFEGRAAPDAPRTQYVIVLLHRALWRIDAKDPSGPGNWDQVHKALVEFNRRPIVRVEGIDQGVGGGGGMALGPRVVAVFAGGTRAYAEDPTIDGIHYVVLGATAARLDQDASVALRHFTLVKFDGPTQRRAGKIGMHPALVELGDAGPGGAAAGNIVPSDILTAPERDVLDKIAAFPNETLGIQGTLDQPLGKEIGVQDQDGSLRLLLNNPLSVPLDVSIRLASTRNLTTETLRENANPYVESFDSPWQLYVPYLARHLEPGAAENFKMSLYCQAESSEVAPPQVEFVVHWTDPRGRVHEVLLKRHVPVIPRVEVPTQPGKIAIAGDDDWPDAASGGTYAWTIVGDEPAKRSPEWDMTADAETLFLRVRVEDATKSFSPKMNLDWRWGGLDSDAVSVAWAWGPQAAPQTVQRVWVLPFAPKDRQLWTNNGVGHDQTRLLPLDPKYQIKAATDSRDDGYTVTLAIPRKVVFGSADNCVMNITVNDNDGGARTWSRSWAQEQSGPPVWGRITVTPPATPPKPK